jgi:hypothetical protein
MMNTCAASYSQEKKPIDAIDAQLMLPLLLPPPLLLPLLLLLLLPLLPSPPEAGETSRWRPEHTFLTVPCTVCNLEVRPLRQRT